jgi:hypothetical protein
LKPSRHNKVLGLSLGEKSLMAAEVVHGTKPQVKHLAEMTYPDGVGLQQPAELGKALNKFLHDKGFSARTAVIGIPVKWLVVRPKEVPTTDAKTTANVLRLQAETEFSSELKDLVYDYAEGQTNGPSKSVLLMATSRKHLDTVSELCEAAKIKAAAVLPSALALGRTTGAALSGKNGSSDILVLSVAAGGSEMTAQQGAAPSAIRYLRAPDPREPFVSELRRTVSTLPAGSSKREIFVWDGASLDSQALSQQVGLPVRRGDLSSLGIDTSLSGANGDGRKYAAAVALAMSALTGADTTVDFLHSRLAPPKEQRIPRWAVLAILVGVALIGLIVTGVQKMQAAEQDVADLQNKVNADAPNALLATKFVTQVSTAQKWHGGKPRYLACLRDLSIAIPDDYVTFITNLTIREATRPGGASAAPAKDDSELKLAGTFEGKTQENSNSWQNILSNMKNNHAFSNVKVDTTSTLARERLTAFTIEFEYSPSKAAP